MRGDGTGRLENLGGALRIGFALATPFLRGRRCRWGLRPGDDGRAWPGDGWVPAPRWQCTQAIDIAAPAAAVWPWVVQLGQGRGGFYSYARLENLVGCQVRNADRVLVEHQDLAVGDLIRLHPRAPPLTVRELDPGRAVVLHGCGDLATGGPLDLAGPLPARYVNSSWAVVVEDDGAGRCRCVTRTRYDYRGGLGAWLAGGAGLLEPVSSVMSLKMLAGLRLRAEGGA